jgi:hypothetical protein
MPSVSIRIESGSTGAAVGQSSQSDPISCGSGGPAVVWTGSGGSRLLLERLEAERVTKTNTVREIFERWNVHWDVMRQFYLPRRIQILETRRRLSRVLS